MHADRIAQVEAAIAALGEGWTNAQVYAQVGGNYAALAAYLKQRRGRGQAAGGRRQDAQGAKALGCSDSACILPPSSLPPGAALDRARTQLAGVQAELATRREALLATTARWAAAQGVRLDGQPRRWGGLQLHDPTYHALREEVGRAEEAYRAVLEQALPEALHAITQLEQRAQQEAQQAWYEENHKDLVEELGRLEEHARTAADERARYIARHSLQQRRHRLQELWAHHQQQEQSQTP
jgi:hypothetical protein